MRPEITPLPLTRGSLRATLERLILREQEPAASLPVCYRCGSEVRNCFPHAGRVWCFPCFILEGPWRRASFGSNRKGTR
jgi:hypothetical protein